MSFVSIKHLNKFYTKDVPVIRDMNIDFPATGLNIVVGKSGCGKTTLLNAIGTMDNDYTGDIIVDGQNLHSLNNKQMSDYKNFGIGYIFQKDDLFEELTVEENLKIVLRMQNKQANIAEALDKVGLKGFEHRKVKYLSGGERQRVSIARVILKDCKVILADEPTSALDSKNGHKIFQLLKEISKERLVIAVTHDTKKAFVYADRILKLSDGYILEDNVINKGSEEGYKIHHKKSNPLALAPIFKFQFSHGLLINIFVALLIGIAMCVCSISKDQGLVKEEYIKYEESGYTDINVKRVMLTQIANNIDDFYISKVNGEASAFEYYFQVASNITPLKQSDIDVISNYDFASISKRDTSVSKLYMQTLSDSRYATTEAGGSVYGWSSYLPTNVDYYIYDENVSANLMCGSEPELNSYEILVSDTFAQMYLKSTRANWDGSLDEILDKDITIYNAYYSTPDESTGIDYVFYKDELYRVKGIVETGQLDYCSYDRTTSQFILNYRLTTQTENAYLNQFEYYPEVFIYFARPFYSSPSGNREIPYMANGLSIDSITYHDNDVATGIIGFIEDIDYRFEKYKGGYYYTTNLLDNPYVDRDNRIKYKLNIFNSENQDLTGNQVILPSDVCQSIFGSSSSSIFSNSQPLSVTLTFNVNGVSIDKEVSVVGISNEQEDGFIYVSEDLYRDIYSASLPESEYKVMVSLSGMDYDERLNLMNDLYEEGYILSPVDMLPGGYSEFIYERSIAVFDEEEEGNISPYNLFSEYYNFANVKKINRLLDILSTIATFTVVMALVVSLGCVFLNERNHRLHIFKLSILGVTPIKMFFMQLVTYVLMAVLTFFLTRYGTTFLVDFINSNVALSIESASFPDTYFIINRIRIILTNNVYLYSAIGAGLVLVIGMICSALAIKQYKK